jgi:hypothetical protein
MSESSTRLSIATPQITSTGHEADLGELGRLEGERADLDVEVGAVDLLPDPRQPRQDQQHEGDGDNHVAVLLELAVVAKEQDRGREQDQPDDEPLCLLARVGGVDPVDHHDPEARQQRHQGEQVRVGVGQREAQEHVRGQAQREEDRAIGQRRVGEDVLALDEDRGEARDHEAGRRQQPQQLAVARAHPDADVSCPRSAARISAIAFF